jgi:hypothetical protein
MLGVSFREKEKERESSKERISHVRSMKDFFVL